MSAKSALVNQLDRISEARSSQRTHLSRKSRSSARTSSARAQERAKVAELLAEKSMLKKETGTPSGRERIRTRS